MAAASLRRIGAVLALVVLLCSLVLVPGHNGVVVADGMGGGFPIEPPPPDTLKVTGDSASIDDSADWFEVTVFISTVSSMVL